MHELNRQHHHQHSHTHKHTCTQRLKATSNELKRNCQIFFCLNHVKIVQNFSILNINVQTQIKSAAETNQGEKLASTLTGFSDVTFASSNFITWFCVRLHYSGCKCVGNNYFDGRGGPKKEKILVLLHLRIPVIRIPIAYKSNLLIVYVCHWHTPQHPINLLLQKSVTTQVHFELWI